MHISLLLHYAFGLESRWNGMRCGVLLHSSQFGNWAVGCYGSFFFLGQTASLNISSRVGFASTHVWTSEDADVICYISFAIAEDDKNKRFYQHGLLAFQLLTNSELDLQVDAYAGYLQSASNYAQAHMHQIDINAKGYAEWFCKGIPPEASIHTKLTAYGEVLFARLRAVLDMVPQPTIWNRVDPMIVEKTNCWGHSVPTPQSALLNPVLEPHIARYLDTVLGSVGMRSSDVQEFKRRATVEARRQQLESVSSYEHELKTLLVNKITKHMADRALGKRANTIVGEIKPYLVGDSLLDIGCGNGLISDLLRPLFKKIQLVDVVQYVPEALRLPFLPYMEGTALPIHEPFDVVLLLTVLHHSADPKELLKLAWAATRRRLIIIESIVGIHQAKASAPYELLGALDEDQIAYAAFVDWFYNRVLHDDVPVPYNFTTEDMWKSVFVQYRMPLIATAHLGQDIDIGPEYHVLFVLEKVHPEVVELDHPKGAENNATRIQTPQRV